MPVVVRKTDPKQGSGGDAGNATTSSSGGAPRVIPPAVFIGAIVVVVLIIGFIAYRMFGPGESWDNSRQGTPPSASSLSAPPQVKRSDGSGDAGKEGAPQDPVGAELPPDVR
ncbi:MAG: hypothetical protein GX446_02050 [Chthonomonadales bacterium]|nr:hypothetical protein [Chthonomonadales bacterium]